MEYGIQLIHNTAQRHLRAIIPHSTSFCSDPLILVIYGDIFVDLVVYFFPASFCLDSKGLCNIWGEQEAYQFLKEPTQFLQRLASIGNLLEVKENWKIMKPKSVIVQGKHLEKLYWPIDSSSIFVSTYHVPGTMPG